MLSCECGAPVFIKKSGECRPCYMKRWFAEHPETEEQRERKRAQALARSRARSEANRDRRPIDVVILEKTEDAFAARERHLQKRREWNAKNVEARRQYRQGYYHTDPNRVERAERWRQTRRAKGWVEKRTPEQQEHKNEYNRRWRAENRERVNEQNARRQREYRRERRTATDPSQSEGVKDGISSA